MSPTPLTDAACTDIEQTAYDICRAMNPTGYAHYCYSTPEQNDAARHRDWLAHSREIIPILTNFQERSLAALQANERQMREALEPFAGIGIEHWPKGKNYFDISMRRDLVEAARAALSPVPPHAGAENTPAAAPGNEI